MGAVEGLIRWVRWAKGGVFVVAQLWVLAGLYYMYAAARAGQFVNTLLGLLFVTGVFGAAMLLRYLLGLVIWWMSIWERLGELQDRLTALQSAVEGWSIQPGTPEPPPPTQTSAAESDTVDIAQAPAGASGLVAATLNQHSFPRLVHRSSGAVAAAKLAASVAESVGSEAGSVDEASVPKEWCVPKPLSRTGGEGRVRGSSDAFEEAISIPVKPRATIPTTAAPESQISVCPPPRWAPPGPIAAGETDEYDVRLRPLVRQWHSALRGEHVANCRRLLEAWSDSAPADFVAECRRELEALSGRLTIRLKEAFGQAVREGDYARALELGGRIEEEFPGTRMADDFRAVEPHLRRRLADHAALSCGPASG